VVGGVFVGLSALHSSTTEHEPNYQTNNKTNKTNPTAILTATKRNRYKPNQIGGSIIDEEAAVTEIRTEILQILLYPNTQITLL
jgi:hypothetical protein